MRAPEYYQASTPPIDRPDGRVATAVLIVLRSATRALRSHLDTLPVDYDQSLTADRFMAGLSFMFARQRYDCAESLIGANMGGTVLGAMARSLFVDGLRWRWIAEDPEARRHLLLGDLLEERRQICETLRRNDVALPNLTRWLMPIPPVADLTGESLTWLHIPPFPSDDALVADFLNATDRNDGEAPTSDPMHLLDAAGLRGAVLVLSFAGHGNFLGHQSCLTEDGATGHDLRDTYEALFMHVAAVGVVTVLHGGATSVPELWPYDVPMEPFLRTARELAANVAKAARSIHRLFTTKPRKYTGKPATVRPPGKLLDPRAVIDSADVTPFTGDLAPTVAAAERYWDVSRRVPVRRENLIGCTLHEALNFGGAYSNLEASLATYDKGGSGPIAVFAARMLLEEAARLKWRFDPSERRDFAARATQYFDDFRARKNSTINLLRGNGVDRRDAERLFELPSHVLSPPPKPPPKGRQTLPTITSMLQQLAVWQRAPRGLVVAYSLLSQVTHATALGCMHTVRFGDDGIWHGNELSPELMALSLDVTCTASAYLIGHSSLILTELSQEGIAFRERLRIEASKVHEAARRVHGLG